VQAVLHEFVESEALPDPGSAPDFRAGLKGAVIRTDSSGNVPCVAGPDEAAGGARPRGSPQAFVPWINAQAVPQLVVSILNARCATNAGTVSSKDTSEQYNLSQTCSSANPAAR
jgi:hypothetical protein